MLLSIGLLQLALASVFLLERGFSSLDIWQAVQPMFAIWVFLWPLYRATAWIWVGLLLWLCVLLAAWLLDIPFWRRLARAWSPRMGIAPVGEQRLHAPTALFLALLLAVLLFEQGMPEFGFGIALSACLAFPLARLLDRLRLWPLPAPLHPEHTLAGHLSLLVSMGVLCSWSIHVYHGVDWRWIVPAASMAACLAALLRILLPQWWNLPLAMLAASGLLWYL